MYVTSIFGSLNCGQTKEIETLRAALEESQLKASKFETSYNAAKTELSEIENRTESDVNNLLSELNVTQEREAALKAKVAELDQNAQRAQTADLVNKEGTDLLQRKYNILREENEALKQGGAILPTQLESIIARVNVELETSSKEHVELITSLSNKMSIMNAELLRNKIEHESMRRELYESKSSKEKIEAKNANNSQRAQTVETELETVRQENSTHKAEVRRNC